MAVKPKIDVLFLGKKANEFGSDAGKEMEAILEVMNEMNNAVKAAVAPLIIVLDLSIFRTGLIVLPSKFIGALGAAASNALIEKVCLCNVHVNILDTLKMLGILSEDEKPTTGPMGKIKIYRDKAETLEKLGIDYDLQL
ncbi:MAG: hypothetical protein HQL10_01705 [Nitrospirae bacterium]|nr:hypothetical protein [Nitrospirota bacterium]